VKHPEFNILIVRICDGKLFRLPALCRAFGTIPEGTVDLKDRAFYRWGHIRKEFRQVPRWQPGFENHPAPAKPTVSLKEAVDERLRGGPNAFGVMYKWPAAKNVYIPKETPHDLAATKKRGPGRPPKRRPK
jgi:hypothetical protein